VLRDSQSSIRASVLWPSPCGCFELAKTALSGFGQDAYLSNASAQVALELGGVALTKRVEGVCHWLCQCGERVDVLFCRR
jgi:hypothetical protein